MKYITNNDIVLRLNIDRRYIINYDKVNSIKFQFHTNNKDNAIIKDITDINIYNYITLTWNELMLMEEGNLQYTYTIQLLDGTVYEDTMKTDYYICTQISNSAENNKVILSNFYTKEEVNDLLDNVSAGDVNLSNYYTKSQVDKLIDDIEVPSTDLSNYYTKSQVDAKIPKNYLTSIPSEYITETELNNKGYLTQHQSLDGYAKLTDIPTDYITSIPSEYITETELNNKGYLTEHQSLDEYAKLTDIPSLDEYSKTGHTHNEYLTSIPNNYITEDELNSAIGDINNILDLINGEVI